MLFPRFDFETESNLNTRIRQHLTFESWQMANATLGIFDVRLEKKKLTSKIKVSSFRVWRSNSYYIIIVRNLHIHTL